MLKAFLGWLMLSIAVVTRADVGVSLQLSSKRESVYPVLVSRSPTVVPSPKRDVSGSGVLVQQGYLLTAAHLIPTDDKSSVFVEANGKYYKLGLAKIDRGADLALMKADLKCPCSYVTTIPLPKRDDRIYSIGYPLYSDYHLQFITFGLVQGYYGNQIVVTALNAPGGSGGGMYSASNGEYYLVGMSVAISTTRVGPSFLGMRQDQNWISFGVSIADIRSFLSGTPVEIRPFNIKP